MTRRPNMFIEQTPHLQLLRSPQPIHIPRILNRAIELTHRDIAVGDVRFEGILILRHDDVDECTEDTA